MLLANDILIEDEVLKSYRDSILIFQDLLLNDGKFDNDNLHVINNVLDFMKAGTKPKRKRNFKIYFETIDIKSAKDLTNLLQEFQVAVQEGAIEAIDRLKNELISQGMLVFTNKYLEIFTSSENKVVQIEKDTVNYNTNNNSDEKSYTRWINEDVNELTTDMKSAYENSSLDQNLVKKFVIEFRKFIKGRLLLKIIEVGPRQIIGIPIQLTSTGYNILEHPFLDSDWELSRPIESLNERNRISSGDIVSANFSAVRNEHFISSLLFVDFNGSEIVPQTIHQALFEYGDMDFIQRVYDAFEIKNEDDEVIKSILIQKMIETNHEIRKQLLGEKKEISNAKNELHERKQEWLKVLNRIDELSKLDEYEDGINQDIDYEKIEYNPQQFISNLQSLFYYNDEQHLIYNIDVLKSFVYAIQSNIITILAGPSGTGKSSIVHAFANAIENVEVRMIPVQSSWTDTQDLLGYFHPTDKAFMPSAFMEAMAEATMKKNKSKLFLICLDEMNLAHVEYYFSEILSAREEKNQIIRLYPKRHWETAKMILREGTDSYERQQSARELIELYPPIFKIPENVRFIGTLNMDHTVKPLSPKVIDRSFIIEINHLSSQEKENIKDNLQKLTGKVNMSYELFEEKFMDDESIENTIKNLEQISILFEDFPNASLNSRGYKHIRKFLSYTKNVEELNEMMDFVIYGKLLPRIEIKKIEIDTKSNNILQSLFPFPLSYEKFNAMLNTKHTVTFW